MTETPTHTPLPYLRDGSLIYALDKSGTCNRITMRIEGGFAANWRRNPERTTDEEVEATAAFVHQAVNSHHRLIEALEPFAFVGEDYPNDTQAVWEMIYRDRVHDWFSYEDFERARALLAATQGGRL